MVYYVIVALELELEFSNWYHKMELNLYQKLSILDTDIGHEQLIDGSAKEMVAADFQFSDGFIFVFIPSFQWDHFQGFLSLDAFVNWENIFEMQRLEISYVCAADGWWHFVWGDFIGGWMDRFQS